MKYDSFARVIIFLLEMQRWANNFPKSTDYSMKLRYMKAFTFHQTEIYSVENQTKSLQNPGEGLGASGVMVLRGASRVMGALRNKVDGIAQTKSIL
jgi:hypothetical protein